MKWRCNIILAIMLGFTQVSGAWTRLTPEERHFISIDGSVGYASLTNSSSELKSGSGVAANFGVGYRLLYNDFLFSTGVEGYYMLNAQSMSDVRDEENFDIYPFPKPLENTPLNITLHLNATEGYDLCQHANLNIPVLFGMEYRRFYFLAGPKVSVNLWGLARTKATVIAKGDFSSEFIMPDEMVDDIMSRQFGPHNVDSVAKIEWNTDVIAHIEVGLRLGDVVFKTGADVPKPKQRYYIAFFFDYGLLNIRNQEASQKRLKYNWDTTNSEYILTPAVMSAELDKKNDKGEIISRAAIHQYSLGIKATILFELPQKKPCVFCNDNNKLPTKRLQGLHVKED